MHFLSLQHEQKRRDFSFMTHFPANGQFRTWKKDHNTWNAPHSNVLATLLCTLTIVELGIVWLFKSITLIIKQALEKKEKQFSKILRKFRFFIALRCFQLFYPVYGIVVLIFLKHLFPFMAIGFLFAIWKQKRNTSLSISSKECLARFTAQDAEVVPRSPGRAYLSRELDW